MQVLLSLHTAIKSPCALLAQQFPGSFTHTSLSFLVPFPITNIDRNVDFVHLKVALGFAHLQQSIAVVTLPLLLHRPTCL